MRIGRRTNCTEWIYAACAFALSLFLLCAAGSSRAETVPADPAARIRERMRSRQDICPEELSALRPAAYADLAGARDLFANLSERLNSLPQSASEAEFGGSETVFSFRGPVHLLEWKETAALWYAYGKRITGIVSDGAVIETQEEAGRLYVRVEFPSFDEIACNGTREEYLRARFALAYLRTVYDDLGLRTDGKAPLPGPEYLRELIHPLGGTFLIKDGWYDARSQGTKLHTGTDIKAPARTRIRSVTDGIVLFIGTMPIPCNCVIIRDRYGYEYHYYHMIERSTFVEEGDIVRRGDVIGLVGNTGNSVANHLHLAVVTPDGRYINPYEMFLAAGIGPIRVNGRIVRAPKPRG